MTPLPGALGGTELVGWRLDRAKFTSTWDSGEGSFQVGGRWNNEGIRTVYAAIDPATALVEVAVHRGFRVLDIEPHVLTRFRIEASADIHIVRPSDVPNPNWLRPGIPSAGQKAFGDNLLAKHHFILIPSVVSLCSWNVIFDPIRTTSLYRVIEREKFAIDLRINPSNLA